MRDHRNAVVIGAGISGLSCALRLLEQGWSVRMIAGCPPEQTTSWVAAAVWFPTLSGPRANVVRWGRETFAELVAQAAADVPGVMVRECLALYREPPGPQWWSEAVGDVRAARPDELPAAYQHGLRFAAPLVEMPLYLPWLFEQARCRGLRFETRRIGALTDVGGGVDLVVNCAGLGARTLIGDTTVVPVRGQLVRVVNPGLTVSARDECHPGGRAYVHPRTRDCILGGTFDAGQWDTTPDPQTASAILERCADLAPALRGIEVLDHAVGLRPARPTVRLEEDPTTEDAPRVIHNYGHGGSGITLSWGCAAEVAAIAGPG